MISRRNYMNIQQILSERRRARKLITKEEIINDSAKKIIENTLIPIFSKMEEKFKGITTFKIKINWNPNDKKFFKLYIIPELRKYHLKKFKYPTKGLPVWDVMKAVVKLTPEYGIESYHLQSADVVACELTLSV